MWVGRWVLGLFTELRMLHDIQFGGLTLTSKNPQPSFSRFKRIRLNSDLSVEVGFGLEKLMANGGDDLGCVNLTVAGS